MIIALDTSMRRRLVAVACDMDGGLVDFVLAEGAVAPALGEAVRRLCGTASVEAVVVATGPGSYSGVRTGMAAGLGLATGTGVDLRGVGSLAVVAWAAPETAVRIRAVADASRGAVYCQDFARGGGGVLEASGPPARIELDRLRGDDVDVVVATGGVSAPGVVTGDPVRALAGAAHAALGSEPLGAAGLSALHVGTTAYAEIPVKRAAGSS